MPFPLPLRLIDSDIKTNLIIDPRRALLLEMRAAHRELFTMKVQNAETQ